MNLDDIQRLAGIVDNKGVPTHAEQPNRSKVTARPGTDEWFNQMFPLNDRQMPAGFRGRKK